MVQCLIQGGTYLRLTIYKNSSFQERHAITHAHTHTRAKAFRSVINRMHKSSFTTCAYSHVTIKQIAVIDFEILALFISILILKAIDST